MSNISKNSISPYIRSSCSEELEQKMLNDKFDITQYSCGKLKNGFVFVSIDWKAENNSHQYKYCTRGCISYTGDQVIYELDFHETAIKIERCEWPQHASLEVGLYQDNIEYTPLFHQNTKYGAIVYFAPSGWDSREGMEVIEFEDEK